MSIDCLQSSKECSRLFIMTHRVFVSFEAMKHRRTGGARSSSTSQLMND